MRSSLQSAFPPGRLVKPRTCGTLGGAACDGLLSGAAASGPGRIRMPPRSSCESLKVPLTYGRAALVSIASEPLSDVSPSVASRSASAMRSLPPVSELESASAPASRPAAIGLPTQLPSFCAEGDLRRILPSSASPAETSIVPS